MLLLLCSYASNKKHVELMKRNMQDIYVRPSAPPTVVTQWIWGSLILKKHWHHHHSLVSLLLLPSYLRNDLLVH